MCHKRSKGIYGRWSLLWFLLSSIFVTVFNFTMAWSQTSQGVSVESPAVPETIPKESPATWLRAPYGVPVEPPTMPATAPIGAPVTLSQRGSAGGSSVRVTPSIAVSERYDSNVLFLPRKFQDYVTNISPSALLVYNNDLIDSSFMGGLSSELYVRNPGLNYVGANAALYANLDNVTGRLIRGWTFRLSDSVLYTPQMPAFAAPQGGSQVGADFVRGIQSYRNNLLTNGVTLQSAYALAPTFSLDVLYSYSMLRFLSDSNSQGTAPLFSTDSHTLTAGPTYRLSASDSINLSYQYQHISYSQVTTGGVIGGTTTGGGQSVRDIQGAVLTWRSNLTRALSAEIAPGAAIVPGIGNLQGTIRAQLRWMAGSMISTISYNRGLYPNFVGITGVLVSDVVAVSITQVLGESWSVSGQYSYSSNRLLVSSSGVGIGVVSVNSTAYNSTAHSAGLSVTYSFSPTMRAIGSFAHSEFNYGALAAGSTIGRDVAMLQFSKTWR